MGTLFSKSKTTKIEIKHRVAIIKPEAAKLSINTFPQNPSFELIIDFSGKDTDIPDDIELKESKDSEPIDLKQAAHTFMFALSDYLSNQYQMSYFDKHFPNDYASSICGEYNITDCAHYKLPICFV